MACLTILCHIGIRVVRGMKESTQNLSQDSYCVGRDKNPVAIECNSNASLPSVPNGWEAPFTNLLCGLNLGEKKWEVCNALRNADDVCQFSRNFSTIIFVFFLRL